MHARRNLIIRLRYLVKPPHYIAEKKAVVVIWISTVKSHPTPTPSRFQE
jgi:hypothetical protein